MTALYNLEVWRADALLGSLTFTADTQADAETYADKFLTNLTFDTAELRLVVPGNVSQPVPNPLTVRTLVRAWPVY